jgi:hypothetical protein
VRSQRAAVDQVAALPLLNRELRAKVASLAEQAGGHPPSLNQVRRRLSHWYRGQLREQIGPLSPPVSDFPRRLEEIGRFGATLGPRLEHETERVISELAGAASQGVHPPRVRPPVASLSGEK